MTLPSSRSSSRKSLRRWLAGALLIATATSSWATTELVVRVSGIEPPLGQIGCALFADASGFPMDNRQAQQQWVPAQADGATCRFVGVKPGRYAISIGHDLNGNRRVDANLLGMPTEPWGVSNNVRPTLRAPRFEEAVFTLPADAAEWVVRIDVAR
ncbi:MAG: DUF2141 domain-containing protein [Ideonella sp.]|jgi:uncharacterized protein (DUF2141 family)|nr:DUF2141 domain-containing protein [Ideonella sp.]